MNREALIEELKRDEGVVFTLYKCSAGKNTIGVGRNLDDRGITEDESDYLLSNDIDLCVEELTLAFLGSIVYLMQGNEFLLICVST